MSKFYFSVVALTALVVLSGCGHNPSSFTIGERFNVGIDPQTFSANTTYTDGLNVIDVARENSSWELTIDGETGVEVDAKSGKIKGIKGIKREIGPQITGYLVDLAEKNEELAKSYVDAMKYYWQYKAGKLENEAK